LNFAYVIDHLTWMTNQSSGLRLTEGQRISQADLYAGLCRSTMLKPIGFIVSTVIRRIPSSKNIRDPLFDPVHRAEKPPLSASDLKFIFSDCLSSVIVLMKSHLHLTELVNMP